MPSFFSSLGQHIHLMASFILRFFKHPVVSSYYNEIPEILLLNPPFFFMKLHLYMIKENFSVETGCFLPGLTSFEQGKM